jgi:hypothetical protein
VERGASAPSARTVKKEKEGGTGGSVSTRAVRGKWEERGGPGAVVPRGGRTGRERQGVQRASDRGWRPSAGSGRRPMGAGDVRRARAAGRNRGVGGKLTGGPRHSVEPRGIV